MWNVCICDDDRQVTETLKQCVADVAEENLWLVTYNNEASLVGDIEDGMILPDVIFMDIKLQHSNGIVVARKILDILPFCQIIFISGYDQYYLDVYEVDHIYFIRKPFRPKTVEKALQRAIRKLEAEKKEIFSFLSHGKVTVLPINRILYFEKDKRRVLIYTSDGNQHTYYGKIESLEEEFSGTFVRCHNSYVVNLSKIRAFQHDCFVVEEDVEIPVSRRYYKEVKEKLMTYIERSSRQWVE